MLREDARGGAEAWSPDDVRSKEGEPFADHPGEKGPAHGEGLGRSSPVTGEGRLRLAFGVQQKHGGALGRADGEGQVEHAPRQRLGRADGMEILGCLDKRGEIALRAPAPDLDLVRRRERQVDGGGRHEVRIIQKAAGGLGALVPVAEEEKGAAHVDQVPRGQHSLTDGQAVDEGAVPAAEIPEHATLAVESDGAVLP